MISAKLTDQEFNTFAKYIEDKSGIYLDPSKKNSLELGLVLRMEKKRLKTYEKYYKFLLYSPNAGEEFKELLSLITINETQFYRYPAQFHALKNEIIPSLVQEKIKQNNHQIKIWSAGCSSGEEAYSIAMVLKETIADLNHFDVQILATDIDKKILAKAEKGIYTTRSLRLLSADQIFNYFTNYTEKKYKVIDKLRRMVKFSYLNLADASTDTFAGGGFDVIFCRNVLIYFKSQTTKVMLEKFYRSLNDGGYFFAGHSESLFHLSEKFKPLAFRNAFIYEKSARPVNKINFPLIEPVKLKINPRPIVEQPKVKYEIKPILTQEQERTKYEKALDFYLQGKFDDCQSLLSELVIDPRMTKAFILQALIYMEKGYLEQAKEQLRQAKKIDPLLPDSYFFMATIYSMEGKTEEAIKELKKTLFINRNFAAAHYNLANLYRIQGLLSEAIREYTNAINDLTNSPIENLAFYCAGFTTELLLKSARDFLDILRRVG